MPCGDGGMITTNDTALYEKLVPMSWMVFPAIYERTKNIDGRPGYSWDYDIKMIGTKSYMIDIMAAICLEQLKKLEGNLASEEDSKLLAGHRFARSGAFTSMEQHSPTLWSESQRIRS